MEIKENILERKHSNYCRLEFDRLKKRRFIDFTHHGAGRMCRMYYNSRTNLYELKPIEKNG